VPVWNRPQEYRSKAGPISPSPRSSALGKPAKSSPDQTFHIEAPRNLGNQVDEQDQGSDPCTSPPLTYAGVPAPAFEPSARCFTEVQLHRVS